jgi:hypothetical protein
VAFPQAPKTQSYCIWGLSQVAACMVNLSSVSYPQECDKFVQSKSPENIALGKEQRWKCEAIVRCKPWTMHQT